MSQLDQLGSTAFAQVRAARRIENITLAKTPEELLFRFGLAVGVLNSASELKALGVDEWAELLEKAEHAYDNHPLVVVKSGDFVESPE